MRSSDFRSAHGETPQIQAVIDLANAYTRGDVSPKDLLARLQELGASHDEARPQRRARSQGHPMAASPGQEYRDSQAEQHSPSDQTREDILAAMGPTERALHIIRSL